MNSQRLSEFEEYFQINESIRVNLFAVEDQLVPQSQLALEDDIPPLFKLANEVSELEQASLRPLRNLGDLAQELAAFLQAQSRKIDLIIIYIFEEKKIRNIINICDDFDMDILKLLKIINKNKKRIYLFSFPFTTLLPLFRLFKFDTKISKLLYSQRVSNEKAKKILNWSPKINIYDFIEKIFNK